MICTVWNGGTAILKPEFPWEFVQIELCAPIELDEGWLLLTHGVGPVRKYSIGAALLDKTDPSKVLARPASRWSDPSRGAARAMYRTSSTPVVQCATMTSSCAVCCIGYFFKLCHDRDRGVDAHHARLIVMTRAVDFQLVRDGNRDLTFNGFVLAEAESMGGVAPIHHSRAAIYQTLAGKIVAESSQYMAQNHARGEPDLPPARTGKAAVFATTLKPWRGLSLAA